MGKKNDIVDDGMDRERECLAGYEKWLRKADLFDKYCANFIEELEAVPLRRDFDSRVFAVLITKIQWEIKSRLKFLARLKGMLERRISHAQVQRVPPAE